MLIFQIIIIASIHQPSSRTFELFDQLLLLSGGKTCFFGPTIELYNYFGRSGRPIPGNVNPTEFLLDAVSSDFSASDEDAHVRVLDIQDAWAQSPEACSLVEGIQSSANSMDKSEKYGIGFSDRPSTIFIILTLLHRSLIKSFRDVVAYGIRVVMYLGMLLSPAMATLKVILQ